MRNRNNWRPTKFIKTKKGYIPNVGMGSRLMVSLLIEIYEPVIKEHARRLLLDLG